MIVNEEIRNKKICILGAGYVGLTLGLVLADIGYRVAGVENNQQIVEDLLAGKPHFYEQGLEEMLKRELSRNFKLLNNLQGVDADIYIISVGTPIKDDKKPNFDFIKSASRDIASVLKRGDLIILRSTVPPGTTRDIVRPILEEQSRLKADGDFYLAFAPERTIEGNALEELRFLPQIVGGINKESAFLAAKLFNTVTQKIIVVQSLEAAEMVKLMCNTYRDTIFAAANMFALICDKFNLDAYEIIQAANFGYPRGGIPLPSPGVGGSCLCKDPYILTDTAARMGCRSDFFKIGRSINEYMPYHVVSKIVEFFKKIRHEDVKQKNIFILGLAFKGYPETSDIRTSSSMDVVRELDNFGANIFVYDAVVKSNDTGYFNIKFCDIETGFGQADAVIIMNNHPSFKNLDISKYFNNLSKPVLFFDTWHLYSAEEISKIKNVTYATLGFMNLKE